MTYKIVQLGGRDAAIHARDDLLGDGDWVNMVHVEAIAEAGDACCDLVELDALLAAIWGGLVSGGALYIIPRG